MSLVEAGWAQTPRPAQRAGKQLTEPADHVSSETTCSLVQGIPGHCGWNIGNIHKLNFLVDTGAYPSVVDQKIAHELKLAEQPEKVNLWNKSAQVRQVVIPSLNLGPVRVDSIPVLGGRPLVLAESSRPQSPRDYRHGRPEKEQLHDQLRNKGNSIWFARGPDVLGPVRD